MSLQVDVEAVPGGAWVSVVLSKRGEEIERRRTWVSEQRRYRVRPPGRESATKSGVVEEVDIDGRFARIRSDATNRLCTVPISHLELAECSRTANWVEPRRQGTKGNRLGVLRSRDRSYEAEVERKVSNVSSALEETKRPVPSKFRKKATCNICLTGKLKSKRFVMCYQCFEEAGRPDRKKQLELSRQAWSERRQNP